MTGLRASALAVAGCPVRDAVHRGQPRQRYRAGCAPGGLAYPARGAARDDLSARQAAISYLTPRARSG